MKIIVGMSGGVDSAVAVYLLKKQGYEVYGVFYKLSESERKDEKRCCDLNSVEYIGQLLGIQVKTIDIHEEFDKDIIRYFLRAYRAGITPNPCTVCNERIKFGLGLEKAQEVFGESLFATGHYATVEKDDGVHLKKGVDKEKDQSYMLWRLSKEQLSKTVLPLGTYTKKEVKMIAKDFHMPPKRESQDVCFINGKLNNFLRVRFGESKGKIVDTHGNVMGEHRGAYLYTIGQRSGLNISFKYPLYVVEINAPENIVVVGSRYECFFKKVLLTEFNLIEEWDSKPMALTGKVRYKSPETSCILKKEAGSIFIEFVNPQFAITPGQSLVLYKGEHVFGGGVIQKAFH